MDSTEKPQAVIAYKGFDLNLRCRDFQYKLGETYTHAGKVERCSGGFHACEHPLDVFGYYNPASSRFALVELSGDLSREQNGDTKIAAGRITIKGELKLPDVIAAAVKYVFDRAKSTKKGTNDEESGAASATGDSGAASATGYSGAASATGEKSAAMASGRHGRAMGASGCAIFLVHRDANWNITHAKAAIAGKDVKAHTWYSLNEAGEFVEVA